MKRTSLIECMPYIVCMVMVHLHMGVIKAGWV